jgi:WD40 repeat protein
VTCLSWSHTYQTGGSLAADAPTYVVRASDHHLWEGLIAGDFCYVFNARQTGKSSLRNRIRQRLEQAGHRCVYLDMTELGSDQVSMVSWYRGVMVVLLRELNLLGSIPIQSHWQEWVALPVVQQLGLLLDEIFQRLPDGRLFILVDEIDSVLSLNFPANDFFAFIRTCHERRLDSSQYQRLTWGLFGVTTPSNLIDDPQRTPFNIGRAIDLQDFTLAESQPLLTGFGPQVPNPEAILAAILHWTGGQPFLTQKLCQQVMVMAEASAQAVLPLSAGGEGAWVGQLVQDYVIHHWESQDDPEHLRTIRNRLLYDEQRAPRLLYLYQRVLIQGQVPLDGSLVQRELLLSGLVGQVEGDLRVKNPIYRAVFSEAWIQARLDGLRPYSQALNAWVASGGTDPSWLLRGEALQRTLDWAKPQDRRLGDVDYRFLQASQEAERQQIEQQMEQQRLQAENQRLRQAQGIRRRSILLGGVSLALLGALGLSWITGMQYRWAKENEVKALASSAQGLLKSDQQLAAMVEALRAHRSLGQLRWPHPAVTKRVDMVLRETVLSTLEQNQMTQHRGGVLTVDISPDGQWIATGSNDRTVKLWNREGRLLQTLAHSDTIHGLAFTADSQQVVTGSLDGKVRVWDLDGREVHRINAHNQPVWGVSTSPDGQWIASAGGDNTVKLWHPDGTLAQTLPTPGNPWAVVFSADSQIIIAAQRDGTLQRWRLDGASLPPLVGHRSHVWDVDICPSRHQIVSASSDQTVKVWTLEGQLLHTLTPPTPAPLLGVACGSQDGVIVASSRDGQIHAWQGDGSFLRTVQGHPATLRSIGIGPDETWLVSASDDGTARIWQRTLGLKQPLAGHTDTIWAIATSPDGHTWASLGSAGEMHIWRDADRIHDLSLNPRAGVFDGTGKVLLTTSIAGLHRLAINQPLPDTPAPWQPDPTRTTTFGLAMFPPPSPDSGQTPFILAVGGDDGVIQIREATGARVRQFKAHRSRIWSLAFHPQQPILASASESGYVKLWRTNGTLIKTPMVNVGATWGIAWSPDGQYLAAASRDDTLYLWAYPHGPLQAIPAESNGLTQVAFSPDGSIMATGGVDGSIKLWNLDGTLHSVLPGQGGIITALAFQADGKWLYSGSDNGQLIAWNMNSTMALDAVAYACDWVRDYLRNGAGLSPQDRQLCSP